MVDSAIEVDSRWWKVCNNNEFLENGRLHTCVEGRYITVFRYKGKLSAIDSVCHHAGGPMTDGVIQDIEELGVTVVLCPWHRFMVSIDTGLKAFQAVEIINGVPVNTGWKLGKVVQRPHKVIERPDGIYVVGNKTIAMPTGAQYFMLMFIVSTLQSLVITSDACSSDNDAGNERCGRQFKLHAYTPTQGSISDS